MWQPTFAGPWCITQGKVDARSFSSLTALRRTPWEHEKETDGEGEQVLPPMPLLPRTGQWVRVIAARLCRSANYRRLQRTFVGSTAIRLWGVPHGRTRSGRDQGPVRPALVGREMVGHRGQPRPRAPWKRLRLPAHQTQFTTSYLLTANRQGNAHGSDTLPGCPAGGHMSATCGSALFRFQLPVCRRYARRERSARCTHPRRPAKNWPPQ